MTKVASGRVIMVVADDLEVEWFMCRDVNAPLKVELLTMEFPSGWGVCQESCSELSDSCPISIGGIDRGQSVPTRVRHDQL